MEKHFRALVIKILFSFCRWRKIQQLDLSTKYTEEKSEGTWLHYCFGLTYLDSENIGEAFSGLISVQLSDKCLTKFADYLMGYYIHEEGETLFPPPSEWKNQYTPKELPTLPKMFTHTLQCTMSVLARTFLCFLRTSKEIKTDLKINRVSNKASSRIDKKIMSKKNVIVNEIHQLEMVRLTFIKIGFY